MFVCLGNICRSPAAEEILRVFVEKEGADAHVESSGIGDWHVGERADERMRKAAENRGFLLRSRAQQFQDKHFAHFDWIFAADRSVLEELFARAKTPEEKAKIHLMLAFSTSFPNGEVPDPYLEGADAFDTVLDMIEDGCQGIMEHLKR